MQVHAYLDLNGRAAEAIEFYRQAIDARVEMLMRYRDSPEPPPPGMVPPGSDDKIMHAAFHVGESLIMASDGACQGQPNISGITLSLTVENDDQARQRFNALAAGGEVQMPLGPTFFAHSFGMVKDRFGVSWMVIHGKPM